MNRSPKRVTPMRVTYHAAAAALLALAGASRAAEPDCPLGNHDGHITELIQFVFFGSNDVGIDPQAALILDNVATISAQIPQCPIRLGGHADTSGPALYNFILSKRRAEAVVAWLRQRGVRAEIRVTWWGEARPLVETGDDVREPQNRRVEITMDWERAPARGVTVETPPPFPPPR
jgi:outer membrane protein OmpA-like peptidoglycan-associated protein